MSITQEINEPFDSYTQRILELASKRKTSNIYTIVSRQVAVLNKEYTPDPRIFVPLLEQMRESYAGSDWKIKSAFRQLIDQCSRLAY